MKKVTVAHSPDADDIFMYYAIKLGWVETHETYFENIADDIETLNQATLNGDFDICAISFGLYPFVKDEYALLKTAVSFGDGYGPKLIKRAGEKLRKNFTVALSGQYTTNALLFKIAYPHARITYMNFLEIEQAVIDKKVDAGVLIHESILNFDSSLEVEKEMWDVWQELSGGGLPLPLGGMCIRRSIPLHRAIMYEKSLTEAVKIANSNKNLLSRMLLERDLIRVPARTLQRYLELYANSDSIEMSTLQYKALDTLYELGYKQGLLDEPIIASKYTIPKEYEDLRNQ